MDQAAQAALESACVVRTSLAQRDLATVKRSICDARRQQGARQPEFQLDTQMSAEQERAFELQKGINPSHKREPVVGTSRAS